MMAYIQGSSQIIQVFLMNICPIYIVEKLLYTLLPGKGRYSVKCQVIGDEDSQINEGFIISRYLAY